jgi:ubiquinone biosynthesis protein COQ4
MYGPAMGQEIEMATQTAPGAARDEDVEYMSGGRSFQTDCSVLRSTSTYLNSPLIRDLYCNEGLRRSGPDVITTSLIPQFYDAFDAVMDREEVERLFEEDAARHPDLAAWLGERYVRNVTMDDVANCAPGTFGAGVRELLESGFKLQFAHLGPAESHWDYMRKRRAQVHDFEHIVTGFKPSMPGEIALFIAHMTSSYRYFTPELAKESSLVSSFLSTTWVLRTALHYPAAMEAMCDALEKGAQLGRSMKRPFVMERWEDYFDWQLPDLRAHFGYPEFAEFRGDWDWVEP